MAWLVVSPLVSLQGMMRSLPVFGLRLTQLAMAMVPAAVAGIVMYGAVSVTRHMFVAGQIGPLDLSVMVVIGAIAYCFVSLGLNFKGTCEVTETLRGIATAKRSESA
jgi:hypothetical protein